MHSQQLVQGRNQELVLVLLAHLAPVGETEQVHVGRNRTGLGVDR